MRASDVGTMCVADTMVQLIREKVSSVIQWGGNMDHNDAMRRFEHLMVREADRAQEAATELDGLVSLLPSDKSRQLARLEAKANHQRAKDFRELAQKVREN